LTAGERIAKGSRVAPPAAPQLAPFATTRWRKEARGAPGASDRCSPPPGNPAALRFAVDCRLARVATTRCRVFLVSRLDGVVDGVDLSNAGVLLGIHVDPAGRL
jgi:hypothetical protein